MVIDVDTLNTWFVITFIVLMFVFGVVLFVWHFLESDIGKDE